MELAFASYRIRGIIKERFPSRGVSEVAERLNIDRATVHRWLSRTGFPRDEIQLLAFAGVLDVDPTVLWQLDPTTFPVWWPRITKAARTGRWEQFLRPLKSLESLVESGEKWPPASMAKQYFRRAWTCPQFRHDPQLGANSYQDLLLRTGCRPPIVWHFAFREDIVGAPWRPYGFVLRETDRATLFHESGRMKSVPIDSSNRALCIQTWFGQRAAVFQVASLHEFELVFGLEQASIVDLPTLRFE
jgi:hypothetical protein